LPYSFFPAHPNVFIVPGGKRGKGKGRVKRRGRKKRERLVVSHFSFSYEKHDGHGRERGRGGETPEKGEAPLDSITLFFSSLKEKGRKRKEKGGKKGSKFLSPVFLGPRGGKEKLGGKGRRDPLCTFASLCRKEREMRGKRGRRGGDGRPLAARMDVFPEKGRGNSGERKREGGHLYYSSP